MNFLTILEEVSKTKKVSVETLMGSMESAMVQAYQKKFGEEAEVSINFDPENGALLMTAPKTCVATVKNNSKEISIKNSLALNPQAKVGDIIEAPVDTQEFGRIAVKIIKQLLSQNLADEERENDLDEIYKKEGTIAFGRVQRTEYKRQGTVFLEIGKMEVALPHKSQIPGENFKIGDRVRVYVQEVVRKHRHAQVTVSRTCPEFLQKLFELEIPEIQEGLVKIYSVAREAGSRTKIAIFSDDPAIDPVGACVGIKGSRISGIVDELHGEKLDIIKYHSNLKEFIVNALSPARVSEVRFNKDKSVAEVFVGKNQISLAIGAGGQNVRLAARLVGCQLELKTEGGEKSE